VCVWGVKLCSSSLGDGGSSSSSFGGSSSRSIW